MGNSPQFMGNSPQFILLYQNVTHEVLSHRGAKVSLHITITGSEIKTESASFDLIPELIQVLVISLFTRF